MPNIALVVDSSNDLPPHILQKYDIRVVPLLIHFGEQTMLDVPEQLEEFWRQHATGALPRTAAPGPDSFTQAFAQALQQADEVIAITLTSKHSSSFNNANLAAQEFGGRVHVFDSWSIALGVGLLTRLAAERIAQGHDAAAILEALHEARSRQHLILYLDSLDPVQRGGRIALAMSAIKRMSSLLQIRVILSMNEGELGLSGAVRSPKKGIRHIIQAISGQQAEQVAVSHTRAPELAATLADNAAAALNFPREQVLVREAGAILGVHGGPRAFGVTYFEKV